MVVVGHVKQIAHRTAGTGLQITGAVDHPGNPGIDDGSGAHGAGLQRHIQRTLPQPPAAQGGAGLVDGLQLRMAQGILPLFPAVAASAHDFPVAGDHAAHRYLALSSGLSGQFQRLQHIVSVFHIPYLPVTSGYRIPKKKPPVKAPSASPQSAPPVPSGSGALRCAGSTPHGPFPPHG